MTATDDEHRVMQDDPATPRAEGPRPRARRKQLEHGAQSDQGGEGQKLDLGGNKPRVWEGGEESNQQRR